LDPATTQPRIEVRDATAGTTALSMNFSRSSNWQAVCTTWFNMANANGELWFALGTAATGSYFVDNVRVEHR
jgi:hypothetical protein